jgi:succinate-semialdehyde dehydrogenase/glutarate-semialdehyde dehydrogenase
MLGAATLLRSRRTDFALLAATEMGKPLAEAEAEVAKCALTCDFYAENARATVLTIPCRRTGRDRGAAEFRHLRADRRGRRDHAVELSVLAGGPLRGPGADGGKRGAPEALAQRVRLAIERLFLDAGFPPGLFATLLVSDASTPAVFERLIADPRVAAVTLTGGERAGAAVGAAAGRALKPTVLELGGLRPLSWS